MKFHANGKLRSHPGFNLTNKVEPFSGSGQIHAGFSAELGEVTLGISEVPIKLRIPFLKRRHAVLIIGTLGPIRIKLDPCKCSLKDVSVSGEVWVGGKEGLVVVSEGKAACETEVKLDGTLCGDLALGKVHLGDECPPEESQPQDLVK
jgi:hypothetical protein